MSEPVEGKGIPGIGLSLSAGGIAVLFILNLFGISTDRRGGGGGVAGPAASLRSIDNKNESDLTLSGVKLLSEVLRPASNAEAKDPDAKTDETKCTDLDLIACQVTKSDRPTKLTFCWRHCLIRCYRTSR